MPGVKIGRYVHQVASLLDAAARRLRLLFPLPAAPAAPVVFVSDAAPPAAPPVKNKLRSALQRSATPGRIADVYKFGRTLGA